MEQGKRNPSDYAPQGMVSAGAGAFDFLHGCWAVTHRKLRRRLAGCDDWMEFGGTVECRALGSSPGNLDDNILDDPDGRYSATTLRLYDRRAGDWSIWWVDGRQGRLEPPVRGRFEGARGLFTGEDELNGRPILVRFCWSGIGPQQARWEQAFSGDGGTNWETNWIMNFARLA